MLSAAVENGVVFTSNGALRRIVAGTNDPSAEVGLRANLVIGAASGVLSALAICPPEVLKCYSQSIEARGLSTWGVASHVVRKHGIRGLWRGLTPLLLRDVPFNAVFFGAYRGYCAVATDVRGVSQAQLPTLDVFVAGGLAGMTAWSIVFPADVVKSCMQAEVPGCNTVGSTVRDVLARAGWRGFFNGWSAAVARAFPANAALFAGYELSLALLRSST